MYWGTPRGIKAKFGISSRHQSQQVRAQTMVFVTASWAL